MNQLGHLNKNELIKKLSEYVTPHRLDLFNRLIRNRTRYLTVVLEDIYQSQNASAVLRTCDCLGIQDVHVIENQNKYSVNPDVALGSTKWLSMFRHKGMENNTPDTIKSLKEKGYRIIATSPHKKGVELNDLDLNAGKAALFFGTEKNGLTDDVLDNADEYLKIKMYGFTESFNISVSAAIILHTLSGKLRSSGINWQMSEEEKSEVMLTWLMNTVPKSDILIKSYHI